MDAGTGELDIDTGVQLPNSQSYIDQYVAKANTVILASQHCDIRVGICVTKAAAQKFNVKSIYDLLRSEIVGLTAQGSPKSEYWIGGADWNSTSINRVQARYYGLTDLYNLTASQPQFEYSPVGNAIKSGEMVLWACDSASNFVFPSDSVQILDESPRDPTKWKPARMSEDPDWYNKSVVQTS